MTTLWSIPNRLVQGEGCALGRVFRLKRDKFLEPFRAVRSLRERRSILKRYSKRLIVTVGIRGKKIQMGCKNLFYMGGDTDRIYICAEVDDILLIKMIVFTYFSISLPWKTGFVFIAFPS